MPLFSNDNYDSENQEIINQIEAQLADMSEEERAAVLAMDDAADRLAIIQLHNKYGVNIELIPGDRHHIMVDGEKMGYAEFSDWLSSVQSNEDEEDEYYDDEEYEDEDEYDEENEEDNE